MRNANTYNRKLTKLQRAAIRRHLSKQFPTPMSTRIRVAAIALVVSFAFVAAGAVTFPMPTR
jgi:hypothetical protein